MTIFKEELLDQVKPHLHSGGKLDFPTGRNHASCPPAMDHPLDTMHHLILSKTSKPHYDPPSRDGEQDTCPQCHSFTKSQTNSTFHLGPCPQQTRL